jgi:uncharacterized protein YcsI (UPF0317 family)
MAEHHMTHARVTSARGLAPGAFRLLCRSGDWAGPTAGLCPGFVQANLVVLPGSHAESFRRFAAANPTPLPVLEELPPGRFEPACSPGGDIRTDCPGYTVFRRGVPEPARDLLSVWDDSMTGFLLGCSFSFERAMLAMGLPVRHVELGLNVPMFRTNRPLAPVAPFGGMTVATMRPIPAERVEEARAASARMPKAHGAPIHAGDPAVLGVADLGRPDYGDPAPVRPGETPVFWACGVSGLEALKSAKLPLAATHAPGHMFVTDIAEDSIVVENP